MNITAEQLNTENFFSYSINTLYHNDKYRYKFNNENNQLTFYSHEFPDEQVLIKIKDFEHLQKIIKLIS